MKLILFLVTVISVNLAQAKILSGQDRGGGDLCEARIQEISNDLKIWIHQDGHKALDLPGFWTPDLYAGTMLKQISQAKVRCVSAGDAGFPVEIDGISKTCRFDRTEDESLITCDSVKFRSEDEENQYVLIHHEYAGLTGLERPKGSTSNYDVSHQISNFLIVKPVKKLAVKKVFSTDPVYWSIANAVVTQLGGTLESKDSRGENKEGNYLFWMIDGEVGSGWPQKRVWVSHVKFLDDTLALKLSGQISVTNPLIEKSLFALSTSHIAKEFVNAIEEESIIGSGKNKISCARLKWEIDQSNSAIQGLCERDGKPALKLVMFLNERFRSAMYIGYAAFDLSKAESMGWYKANLRGEDDPWVPEPELTACTEKIKNITAQFGGGNVRLNAGWGGDSVEFKATLLSAEYVRNLPCVRSLSKAR